MKGSFVMLQSPASVLMSNLALPGETWCSPCYAFECPYNLECLDIPPEEVVEAGLSLLAEAGDRAAKNPRQEESRA